MGAVCSCRLYRGRLPIKVCYLNGMTGLLYHIGRKQYLFRLIKRNSSEAAMIQTFINMSQIKLTGSGEFMKVEGIVDVGFNSKSSAVFKCPFQ